MPRKLQKADPPELTDVQKADPPELTDFQKAENCLNDKKYEECLKLLRPMYRSQRQSQKILSLYWQLLSEICDWGPEYNDIVNDLITVVIKTITKGKKICIEAWDALLLPFTPSQINIITINATITERIKNFDGEPLEESQTIKTKNKGPIILGIMSSDIRDHAYAHLIRSWLQNHDRTKMIIIIFSTMKDKPGKARTDYQITEDMKNFADDWVDMTAIKPYGQDLAKLIRDKNVDILIDCNGHTKGDKLYVFMHRPAKIVVSYLGFPGPIGSEYHDYVLTDLVVAPFPVSVNHCLEKIAYINPCYFTASHLDTCKYLNYSSRVYTSTGKMIVVNGATDLPSEFLTIEDIAKLWTCYKIDDSESCNIRNVVFYNCQRLTQASVIGEKDFVFTTRDAYDLPNDKVIFYSNNQTRKLNPETIDKWIEILQKVPNGWLWINQLNRLQFRNIKSYINITFPSQPDIMNRISCGSYIPSNMINQLKYVVTDIHLDSLPCCGHTTTVDALATNTPVLTLKGSTWSGRVSTSILLALKMDELITLDRKSFIQKGIELGNDPEKLTALSLEIQAKKSSCEIWNGEHIGEEMYRLCKTMMERYDQGLGATHLLPPSTINEGSQSLITLKDLKFGPLIINGLFGQVNKSLFRGRLVAVKCVETTNEDWKQVLSELEVYMMMDHPGILKLIAAFGQVDVFLITEIYLADLESYLLNNNLSDVKSSQLAVQLITGLQFVHGKNVLHRNINIKTCLIGYDGNLKVSNFENAVICTQTGRYQDDAESQYEYHISPEIVTKKLFSFQSDVFAAGTVIYYIFRKSQIFQLSDTSIQQTDSERIVNIEDGVPQIGLDGGFVVDGRTRMKKKQRLTIPDIVADMPLRDAIIPMVEFSPTDRPTCSELLEDDDYQDLWSVSKLNRDNVYEVDTSRSSPLPNVIPGDFHVQVPRTLEDPASEETAEQAMILKHLYFENSEGGIQPEPQQQIQVGSKVILNFGYLKGEIAVVEEIIIEDCARVKLLLSQRIKEDRVYRIIPLKVLTIIN